MSAAPLLSRQVAAPWVLAALLAGVAGCARSPEFIGAVDGSASSDAGAMRDAANDLLGRADASVSCDWPPSTVTESAAALYLAGTGYTLAPNVYEPDGSVDDITLQPACLKSSPDGGANGLYEAVFSATSTGSRETYVPIGAQNAFSPPPAARSQVELFAPASGAMKFAVAFNGAPITWSVGTQSVTASASSPPCAPEYFLGPPKCLECPPTDPPMCGDGKCDYPEDCRLCPGDCDCTGLTPLFDCVRPRADGTYEGWFGYRATTDAGLTYGPSNRFSPGNYGRGQPEYFVAGEYHGVTVAVFSPPSLTWTLGNQTAQATPDGPACPDCALANCQGPGVSCAGDSCQLPCGDGWCNGWLGEGPWTCPDDCVCSGCQVDVGNSCGNPAQCGLDWECGSGLSFGVFVDCGSCPGGATCFDHLCQ